VTNLTALLLTYNESPNIERTLSRLTWIDRVIVVDSFSEDDTVEIARSFSNVIVEQRAFDEHTHQWEFGRKIAGEHSKWVISLDSDYYLTDEIIEDIQKKTQHSDKAAHFAHFKYAIQGKVIESGIYNPVAVLFDPNQCYYQRDGHTQRLFIDGETGEKLSGSIIHDDRKSFAHWLQSQVNYAKLEVEKLAETEIEQLSKQDKTRLKSKWAPFLVFFYCLIYRKGWKDGTAGWIYAFQRLIAEVVLQVLLLEKKLRKEQN
jgi:glycosyltransferase involved in cell wall biosynthesis